MASWEELSDEIVLAIFEHLDGDAKQLFRCTLVCKRWSSLVRYVDRLHFEFKVGEPPEQAIEAMSRFHCVRGLRLDCGDGIWASRFIRAVKRTIECIEIKGLTFFHNSIWDDLSRCKKLFKVSFYATVEGLFLPPLLAELKNLKELVMDEMEAVFPETLASAVMSQVYFEKLMESVMEHCSKLETLVVRKRQAYKIQLKSSSVKEAHFQGIAGSSFIMLEMPSLTKLSLDAIGCVLVAPQLRQLHLPTRCKDLIVVAVDRLELLTMQGDDWEFDEVHGVVELTSSVPQLLLKASVVDPRPVVWSRFFKDLSNLKSLVLGGNLLECFCQEVDRDVIRELKLTELTIVPRHGCFQVDELTSMLQTMLEDCTRLEVVVVNLSEAVGDPELPESGQSMPLLMQLQDLQAAQPKLRLQSRVIYKSLSQI